MQILIPGHYIAMGKFLNLLGRKIGMGDFTWVIMGGEVNAPLRRKGNENEKQEKRKSYNNK